MSISSRGGNRKEQVTKTHALSLSSGQVEGGSDGVDEQTVDPIDGPLAHRFIGHGPPAFTPSLFTLTAAQTERPTAWLLIATGERGCLYFAAMTGVFRPQC